MGEYSIEKFIRKLREENAWYRAGAEPLSEGFDEELKGVNLCGYLRDESGWGAAGRGYARALASARIPHALLDLSALSSNRSEDSTPQSFDDAHPFPVNLICVDAGQHYALLSQAGEEFFAGRYNIGLWAWELPRFPEKWYDRFAFYDEIWVGTSFIAGNLAPISPVPVIRVPPVLMPRRRGSRQRGRARLELHEEQFVFLFIFDFHSHLARKNPLAVVDAFRQAFAHGEPARLVVKCVNEASDPGGYQLLRERAREHSVTILAGYWPAEEVQDLMAACDAYVSLHRSEGTGLTISDAMAYAKPVIATGWSGNMDFMNVANSYPVRFALVEVEENVGPYRAGETWAEPSVPHATELMRHVYQHRGEAAAIGEAARRQIEENYSEQSIAALIRQRLSVIESRERFAVFKREVRTFQEAYRRLAEEIRAIVERELPAGSSLLVISKGDARLLEFTEHRAGHFPQTPEGEYAGYYPASGREAVAELEELRRARGYEYLLIPATAEWWLMHYGELGEYLRERCGEVWRDRHCLIFHLAKGEEQRG